MNLPLLKTLSVLRKRALAGCLSATLASLLLFLLLFAVAAAHAQSAPPVLINQSVDEANLVTLGGNTRPEAKATNDLGRVDDSLSMDHMLLLLKR